MGVGGAARRSWGAAVLVLQAAWALVGGQVRYSVPEEAEAGTVVGRLAQDLGLEAGEAEARRLRLVSRGRRASVEVSGASGALVVSSRLDREELCGKSAPCALRLEVLLDRPLRVFHVEVEVTDINDNAPRFPAASKNISVWENSPLNSRFPLEGASDADIGSNAMLSYTLSASEHFTLDVKSPNENLKSLFLVLTRPLDRESLSEHRLVLTASDGGRPALTGTVQLVISVLDANDNAPQFNQSVYKVQLPEDASLGTMLLRVAATDPDERLNQEFSYSIVSSVPAFHRDAFSIDPRTGEIRLTGALDFEDVPQHELQIEARDKGTPPLSGHCSVILEVLDVEVTDINDNAPRFPAASKNISVAELSLPGTRFPLEGASDADIGSNAQLSYTLSPSEHFALDVKSSDEDRKSLFLVLTRPLDRESLSEHRLVLTASDGGRPVLTGTVQLVISVLDANDNAPQFNQSVYKVQLPEDATPGTLVALVAATDPDEGINQEFSYSIVSSVPASQRDAFSIDPRTGKIQLIFPLDFEDVRLHELQIEARDKGFPPLAGHCSVELEVLDVNDNAPEVWVTSLSVPVSEDAALGTVVALLSVSDRDSGPNGRVRCAVRPPSPFGLVATFAGSYSLVLREALDRERVSEYEVEVRAEDGGAPPLRAIRGLRVPVSDVNDNAPAFSQAVYTVGSWSYSQRHSRSLCVATDGAGKSDLMVFSPNCPPPPGPAPKETSQDPPSLLDTVGGLALIDDVGQGRADSKLVCDKEVWLVVEVNMVVARDGGRLYSSVFNLGWQSQSLREKAIIGSPLGMP
ncbi:UNVERIFIED_CONTAM: hypothetical protein H355_011724 [Colinus virginianus]|nr:hypothetical protein H355_011724 [Colinus virginianus]